MKFVSLISGVAYAGGAYNNAGVYVPDLQERGYLYYKQDSNQGLQPFQENKTSWYAIKLNTIDVPRGWSLKGDFTVRLREEGDAPELVVNMNLMIGLKQLTVKESFMMFI